MNATIPNLHDATLIGARFNWGAASLELSFAGAPYGPSSPFTLTWSNVVEFRTTRNEPWGASSSVLELKQTGPDTWLVCLQSGDDMIIRGGIPALLAPSSLRDGE